MDTIHFESVSKVFRRGHFLFKRWGNPAQQPNYALREISIGVTSGKVLALLGPNGSGKTTLLKLVSTMLLPDAGRVMVGGQDTHTAGAAIRKRVGFVANERSFFPRLSARENLDFFAALDDVPRNQRRPRIDRLLSQVGLHEQSNSLVMRFSTGMYQRLGIARALLKSPSVVLLDEPTRSLDPDAAVDFWDSIKALRDEGATVIVATHNFDEASALADSVAILQQGRLLEHATLRRSTPQQLRSLYLEVTAGPANSALAAVGSWQ
jgi:ABC-2 type transport system ATP-binding protein